MVIRKATAADVDSVAKIYLQAHDEIEKGNLFTGWVRDIYPLKSTAQNAFEKDWLFVAEENGEIVSYLRIIENENSQISIGRGIVRKNYRKKGIAREMMLKAIEFVVNNLKEDVIKIQAQAYLLDFYSSLGFKATSDEYLEDNIPHIDMIYKK